jgi:hypothetical protein
LLPCTQLHQVGVELRQKPSAGALLCHSILERGWIPRKKGKETPTLTAPFEWALYGGCHGPAQCRDGCKQSHFIVDVAPGLCPETQDKRFSSTMDEPVLIDPSAQRSDQPGSEYLQYLVRRLNQ